MICKYRPYTFALYKKQVEVKESILTGILICIFAKTSFCQVKTWKISGKINDITTGAPLEGASVLVEGAKGGVKTDV